MLVNRTVILEDRCALQKVRDKEEEEGLWEAAREKGEMGVWGRVDGDKEKKEKKWR